MGKFKIIGWIAIFLGKIMDVMYNLLDAIGIHSIGIAIILFTFIIYTLLLPLTYRQQKFSKLSQKMNPELKAIQKKYNGKKDQASQQKMAAEQRELYDKYGISPTGSCLQLFIQIPIIYALYRVVYNIPAYVTKIREVFDPAVSSIMGMSDYKTQFDAVTADMNINLRNIGVTDISISGLEDSEISNRLIDILYKFTTDNWNTILQSDAFSSISSTLSEVHENLSTLTTFLGLNIANTPMGIIKTSWAEHSYGMLIIALLIPIFSALTQLLNFKVMPQNTTSVGGEADQVAQSMKTMNYTMPIFSLVFVFSLPVGIGIYWIAGALIRCLYSVLLNRHFDKMDLNDIIEKNKEKAAKKKEKRAEQYAKMTAAAQTNTRNIKYNEDVSKDKEDALAKANEIKQNAKPGSLAAKANLVKEFNEGKTNK